MNRSDLLFPNTIFDNTCGNNRDGASRQVKTMTDNSIATPRSEDDCEVLCMAFELSLEPVVDEAFESGPMTNESLLIALIHIFG